MSQRDSESADPEASANSEEQQQSPAEEEQQQTPPDPAEQLAQFSSRMAQLESDLAAAKALAEDARNAARRAQGQSQSTVAQLERQYRQLQQAYDELATRDMTDEQRELYQMRREIRESKDRPAPNVEAAVAAFQEWAQPVLAQKGVKVDDPRLVEAFERHRQGSDDIADWKAALGLAVAEVKEDDAKKAREEAAERERLAREEERAKSRSESRTQQGRIDRGTAVSGTKKNPLTMSEAEFEEWERQKDASVGRVPSGTRAARE